uniref:DUF4283 domain-containing protein n=1 Tax=Salix viminalis TaxID=40686 RepID=A0A6N2LEQ4_SALVM
MDMLTENAEQWSRCMVGFFPGFRMNYHTVTKVANRVWKTSGLESVMSTVSGFWIFRFQTEDQMQAILERGPWMFGVEYEWKSSRCEKCKLFGHSCKQPVEAGEEDAGEEDAGLKGDKSMVSISEKGHKELESHIVGTHKQTKAVEPTRKAKTHTTHQRWDENGNPKQKGDQVANNEDEVPTGGVSKVANAAGKPSPRTEGQGSKEEEVRLLKGKAKVDSLPLGTVNETISLLSKSFSLNEEESSPEMGMNGAKLCWKSLCYPLQEGGLGIKRIRD